ncbi:MAG: FMN-dependent NADH-azoreductase [Alcanivoracaceae bacterium]|nr:FMN-dependent NADH-azoreductase [Alcanivoracaceae bacterium]
MSTLLLVKSSILGDNGQSSFLAEAFVKRWLAAHPDGQVITRDVGASPLPHLDGERFGAFTSDADSRSPAQQAVVDESDALVDELKHADVVVLGLPMYNFGVPSQLKSWFDHIARAGVTFEYTSEGPKGLLRDKPVFVFAARGGMYHASGNDHQVPFVRQFLGFIGLKQVHVTFAEGLAMGDQKQASLDDAMARMDTLVETARQAA